jgi:hypothetical protein
MATSAVRRAEQGRPASTRLANGLQGRERRAMRQPRSGQYYNLSGGDPEDCMVRESSTRFGNRRSVCNLSSPMDPGRCLGITTLMSMGSGPRA